MERGGCIYILTNKNKTTLYIGVTSDLRTRLWQHKNNYFKGSFSSIYNLTYCVYYETFSTIEEAIDREKQLKRWRRDKKNTLINSMNPDWIDLWLEIEQW